jgi:CHASE2 domain-containing sensor protein
MAAELEVKSAGANIQANAISTIVLGFAADPMGRWVWPDPAEYLRIMPQFVMGFGGQAFEHGTAYIG